VRKGENRTAEGQLANARPTGILALPFNENKMKQD
jgi:hypothetical protein